MGESRVIHFASEDGTKSGALIRWATIEDFAGAVVRKSRACTRFEADQVAERARSMLEEAMPMSRPNLISGPVRPAASQCSE